MFFATRQRRIGFATAVLAVGVPATAAAWLDHRVGALADKIGTAAGAPARIGSIDADLTGTIRLSDVAIGELVSADSIEGSVALDSLLAGELGADEIRVRGPRVAIKVDPNGDSDLARLVRRLVHAGSSIGTGTSAHGTTTNTSSATRVRRIVVASGSLVARIAGVGEITADDVELVPDGRGVRVLTGAVTARGATGPLAVELQFQRSAAELALPQLKFGRVLAVAGNGSITTTGPDGKLELRDVAVGRLHGSLQAEARVVEAGGGSHPLALELDPRDFAVTMRGDHIPLRVVAGLAPHGIGLADARATGAFGIRRSAGGIVLAVDGALDNLRIDHHSIAAAPIALSASLHGSFAVTPDSISVTDTTVTVGAAQWTLSGWLRRGGPASGQLDVQLAPAACSELMASLPAEIRGPLDGMAMTGTLGAHAHLSIDLAAPAGDGVELANVVTGDCHVEGEPPGADVTALATPLRHQFPDGTLAKVGRGTAGWIELPKVPGHVAAAFVSAEDGRFWNHAGFDLQQIAKSLEIDLREHRLARGGSTISQQLIKNAFLSQRRSVDRKFQEAVLTWRLEAKLDKKAILERYLNIIELGPHVFGIGAAAHHWFDADAHDLTIRQAAFLAALTSEPQTMSRRIRRADGLDPDSAARVDTILRAMKRDGAITKDQLDAARAAPLHFAPRALH